MSIDPDKEQVKGLLKMPKDKPVVMVNLLKFKDKTSSGESGQAMYARYSEKMQPLLKKYGAQVLFAGSTQHQLIGDDTRWDSVVCVQYPTPRDFIKMSSSPEYQEVKTDRESALEKTSLLVNYKLTD